jgi:hypothetical protein
VAIGTGKRVVLDPELGGHGRVGVERVRRGQVELLVAQRSPRPQSHHYAAVARLPPARLVTLSGAGGSGKTRLALQVAHDLLPGFPDGVYFVDLAAVVDLELLPEAIAGVLGLPIRGERPNLQWLIPHLH